MVERHATDVFLEDNFDFHDMHHIEMSVTVQLSGSEFSSGTN